MLGYCNWRRALTLLLPLMELIFLTVPFESTLAFFKNHNQTLPLKNSETSFFFFFFCIYHNSEWSTVKADVLYLFFQTETWTPWRKPCPFIEHTCRNMLSLIPNLSYNPWPLTFSMESPSTCSTWLTGLSTSSLLRLRVGNWWATVSLHQQLSHGCSFFSR